MTYLITAFSIGTVLAIIALVITGCIYGVLAVRHLRARRASRRASAAIRGPHRGGGR